jgi:hypothetical protein
MKMKLSNKYKSSEYIFLFSILVLALLLGTYFSFYAFLWRDIKSEVKGFSKNHHMNFLNYQEGMMNGNKLKQNLGERVPSSNIRGLNPKMPGNIPA